MNRFCLGLVVGVSAMLWIGCSDNSTDSPDTFLGSPVWQHGMGTAVNIHDMAFAGADKAYVTRYQSTGLLVISPASGATLGTIDLTGFGVPDSVGAARSLPYMNAAMVIGDRLYVQCQRLTIQQGAYGPTPMPCDSTGLLVVVSSAADQVVDTVTLIGKNPADMDTAGGALYVACTGNYYSVDTIACLERVDLLTGQSTLISGETAFGGDISTLVMASPTRGYLQVTDPATYGSRIVEFDPASGVVRDTLETGDASGGMAFDGRYLYVGDRGVGVWGVVVIDTAGNVKLGSTLLTDGLPPYSLAVLRSADSGAATYVVVGTSDYTNGNVATVRIGTWETQNNLKAIHGDNKVVSCTGSVYVLELFGQDRITRYDPQ